MSLESRISAVRDILSDTALDAVLITNPANRRYLTGFTAEDHSADESSGVVLITPDSATLYVSGTNRPWAVAEADGAQVQVEPWLGSIPATIAERGKALRFNHLAVEDATTPAALWFELQERLGEDVTLVRAGDAVDRLRAIKDSAELELLREAARRTEQAFEIAVARFDVDMTERHCADLVRDALQEVGSEGEAFDTIVASGPNAAKPHHRPGDRPLRASESIIIDMGACVSGYNGDLTRTICLGEADSELIAVYNAVLDAQLAGLQAIRAGVPASDPDQSTREVFTARGLDQYVIHGAGHGLGLRVHEAPSLRGSADATLSAGNVITMEPGLYIEGWGGVRIEDVAIVRDDGYENITSAPKGVSALQRH